MPRLRAAGLAGADAAIELRRHAPAFVRDEEHARFSFAVFVNGQPAYHLTAAADLAESHTRARTFAEACPEIACKVVAFLPGPSDLLVTEYFAGEPLDDAVLRGACTAENWLGAVRRVMRALEKTQTDSAAEARKRQVGQWTADIAAARLIAGPELQALAEALLANLDAPARVRWTNGDFTGRNLLVDSGGNVRLVDTEFALRTHFPGNDWRRLLQFSTLPNGVHTDSIPECAPYRQPGADLAFWLEHLALLAQVTGRVSPTDFELISRHLGNAHYLLTGTRLQFACRS